MNGAGATTLMELLSVFRRVAQVLDSERDQAGAQRRRRVHHHPGAGGIPNDDCAHGRGIDRALGCAGETPVFRNAMSDVIGRTELAKMFAGPQRRFVRSTHMLSRIGLASAATAITEPPCFAPWSSWRRR